MITRKLKPRLSLERKAWLEPRAGFRDAISAGLRAGFAGGFDAGAAAFASAFRKDGPPPRATPRPPSRPLPALAAPAPAPTPSNSREPETTSFPPEADAPRSTETITATSRPPQTSPPTTTLAQRVTVNSTETTTAFLTAKGQLESITSTLSPSPSVSVSASPPEISSPRSASQKESLASTLGLAIGLAISFALIVAGTWLFFRWRRRRQRQRMLDAASKYQYLPWELDGGNPTSFGSDVQSTSQDSYITPLVIENNEKSWVLRSRWSRFWRPLRPETSPPAATADDQAKEKINAIKTWAIDASAETAGRQKSFSYTESSCGTEARTVPIPPPSAVWRGRRMSTHLVPDELDGWAADHDDNGDESTSVATDEVVHRNQQHFPFTQQDPQHQIPTRIAA